MASSMFGWDLLYNSVKKDVKNDLDVLVCFTHLVLVSNGFKCIGLGESKNVDGSEIQTEALPYGWNDNYAIRYLFQGRLYNFRGTNMDDAVMINLIRVDERTVSMVQLNKGAVIQRTGTLSQILPNNEHLAQTIQQQLIDKLVVSTKTKDGSSQTAASEERNRTHLPSPLQEPLRPFPVGSNFDPLGVGRSDLDPFGGRVGPFGGPGFGFTPLGGGGMLFAPPRGGPVPPINPNIGVPGGSVPPGARFDPFRPPDIDRVPQRPRNPDNDELPPPGFDDMFM